MHGGESTGIARHIFPIKSNCMTTDELLNGAALSTAITLLESIECNALY